MWPVLFKLGPFVIYSYWVCIALGYLAAYFVIERNARRYGINDRIAGEAVLIAVVVGLSGARLLHLITEYEEYRGDPWKILKLWEGGLVFYGGLVTALLAIIWCLKREGVAVGTGLDAITPGLALGHGIGRIGCFLAGCCYGTPSQLPWAVTFRDAASLAPLRTPIHPAQLYESAGVFVIFLVLILLSKRPSLKGTLFWVYLMLYSVLRFFLEFVRGDTYPGKMSSLSLLQEVSIVLFVLAVLIFLKVKKAWR